MSGTEASMRVTLSGAVRKARTKWPGRLSRGGVWGWWGGSRWGVEEGAGGGPPGAPPPAEQNGDGWRLGPGRAGSMLSTRGTPTGPLQAAAPKFQALARQALS